jgi:hypothetical protein
MGFISCDNTDVKVQENSIVGFWHRETVYLNGINSAEYFDLLNGTSFLSIKSDNTFDRPYDFGTWLRSDNTFTLKRSYSGIGEWEYTIIEETKTTLVIEMQLNESEYCCGFDEFDDNEIITIKEVYKRIN